MDVVYSSLGAGSRRVRVGPGRGLDDAAISVGGKRVLILTVDPISLIPPLGVALSAWLSVHLIASDYITCGSDPEFATFSYNFPPEVSGTDREEYVKRIGGECKRLGVAIVGGHTGSYPGARLTVIGTGSMLGLAREGRFVTSSMARDGDSLLVTKGAAIEATGTLAHSFPRFVEERTGRATAKKAQEVIGSCSVVEDGRAARRAGLGPDGVSAMHDCTEGGVLGALEEMAGASGMRFEVDPARVPVSQEAKTVCAAFSLDPLETMGEGALLVACSPERVDELKRRLSRKGVPVSEIGRVRNGEGLWLSRKKVLRRYRPHPDQYWRVYDRAVRAGLR